MKSCSTGERPSVVDPAVHPLVAVPHNGSMPSTHAASAFAAALAVGFVHPKLRWSLLALATLISLSRVWLGVHYLSDVIVGAAVGCAVAWACGPQPSRRSSVSSTFANRRLSHGAATEHEQQPVGGRGALDLGRERDERAVALGPDLPGDRADGRPEHRAADETGRGFGLDHLGPSLARDPQRPADEDAAASVPDTVHGDERILELPVVVQVGEELENALRRVRKFPDALDPLHG